MVQAPLDKAMGTVRKTCLCSPETWSFIQLMLEFRSLPDDHPDLDHSPLLRGACLILRHAEEEGQIGLTATKAFKRDFVHWAVMNFQWPGKSAEEVFRDQKHIKEADFQPLELLHFLLIHLRLGRHYKGSFRTTNDGRMFLAQPARLFDKLVPFFLLNMDHAAYSRMGEAVPGDWDIWLNVMNLELENGMSERELFEIFYGVDANQDRAGWRQKSAFRSCVLSPLEWAGFITLQEHRDPDGSPVRMVFKTPLWCSFLELETDHLVRPATRH